MKSSKSNFSQNEFYASIKLISGEEILTYVLVDDVDGDYKLILDTPIVIKDIINPKDQSHMGYKFEPWMKIPEEDVFVIDMTKVITVSEVTSEDLIDLYKEYIENGYKSKCSKLTKQMGYVSSVKNARMLLEKLYNN